MKRPNSSIRFKIWIYRFTDIGEGLIPGFSLRPASLQQRHMSDEVPILARLDDHLYINILDINTYLDRFGASS
jgi:hypothetical protein